MRQVLSLPVLLLAVACAQAPGEADTSAAMQDALASHQASMAGLGRPSVSAPAEGSAPAPGGPRQAVSMPGGAPSMAGGLVGQTPEQLLQWLGEPRLRRSEGPAEIWHYQASQCHLDLILYMDEGARPVLRVAHAAARAAGAARRGEAACLRDIARGAARPATPGLTGNGMAGA